VLVVGRARLSPLQATGVLVVVVVVVVVVQWWSTGPTRRVAQAGRSDVAVCVGS
jgi:hypothetical protein